MSGFQANVSNLTTDTTILTGNSATDILEADLGTMTVTHIDVANVGGGSISVTIDRTDGTTVWKLCNASPIAQYGTLQVSGTVLPFNQKLRATSSDGSGNLHVHVHHTSGAKLGGGESGH